MKSVRRAAKRILRSAANTGDRFNLVAFRDRYSYAFRKWMECDQPSFTAADRWIDSLAAHGRTDVFATISSVLTLPRDPKRPLIALVVTDGDANHGVSGTEAILSKFSALNDGLVSVYMYGVKESSNRRLIDILTRSNRGESFIFEGSRFEAGSGIDALSERFRDPLLSDLRIVFSSATEAETYPRLLRNLYRGTERHYQRASNHNGMTARAILDFTERDYQRASNHNEMADLCSDTELKEIIKEHKFTTPARILMKCLRCIISVFVIYRKGLMDFVNNGAESELAKMGSRPNWRPD